MKQKESFFTGEQVETARGDASVQEAKKLCDGLESQLTALQEQIVEARENSDADKENELKDQAALLREELQVKRGEWLELSRQFPYVKKAA